MKQFIVDRHTTPNTPTLEQVPTEKIPIYNDIDAVTADLDKLSVGQIVATKDTGSELSAPVDTVQSGNMHAVTSNAVAESLSYSTTEQKTGGVWLDGKPRYTKAFTYKGATTVGNGINLGSISNFADIIDMNVTYKFAQGAVISMGYMNSDNGKVLELNITDTGNVVCYTPYNHTSATINAFVEYTKTTD